MPPLFKGEAIFYPALLATFFIFILYFFKLKPNEWEVSQTLKKGRKWIKKIKVGSMVGATTKKLENVKLESLF